jgi:hypothetical protein
MVCGRCGRRFNYHCPAGKRLPTNCGRIPCRAVDEYGPDDWEGVRRMTAARKAAGRLLTYGPLDANGKRTMVWTDDITNELDRQAHLRKTTP